MDAQKRFEMLFEIASSTRSIDVGRSTIYTFPKYCRSCNAGMTQPKQHERREIKKLFMHSFCSVACQVSGPIANLSTFPAKAKETHEPSKNSVKVMEEMAFASIEAECEKRSPHGIMRMVAFCEKSFRYVAEKLKYMSDMTGERWYSSKYYYWAGKVK